MSEKIFVVVPWHNEEQRAAFLEAWRISKVPRWLVLQRDKNREGCAMTKNKGVREAMRRGADIVVILDDDCFPSAYEHRDRPPDLWWHAEKMTLPMLSGWREKIEWVRQTTTPPARGTPYVVRALRLPVAAVMGFWEHVADLDAARQLVNGWEQKVQYHGGCVFGQYFALSGMNLAFRPREWLPWCEFIDVPRFDDIWMGWLWQKEAYRRGYCFNLNGPLVRHVRQSNVWANLRAEAPHLERNETLWRDIALSPEKDYEKLKALI